MQGAVLQVRSLPHLLDVVELANLGAEDMDDDIARINQHPVSAGQPLDPGIAMAGLLESLDQVVSHGGDMAMRSPGGDDHVVGKAGLALDVNGNNVFGLGVFKRFKGRLKGCLGAGSPACLSP